MVPRTRSHASSTGKPARKQHEFNTDVAFVPPPFTLEEIRSAIPPECFRRQLAWSLFYFFRDLASIAGVYALVYEFRDTLFIEPMSYVSYPLFWYIQGTLFWALFVIGHDCGHGSFSDSERINYMVGHIAHSAILVPFHSWRLSHRKHHQNTGNVRKDESFIAVSHHNYQRMWRIIWFFRYPAYWAGGWVMYLMFGMPLSYFSHFNPWAKTWKSRKEQIMVCNRISLVWWSAMAAALFTAAQMFGVRTVALYYGGPYAVFAAWIAIVTHCHHTHPDVPWFRDPDWTFVRGALSTIDSKALIKLIVTRTVRDIARNYGPVIEHLHHNIGTHVVHHLFSRIPHYNLRRATDAIAPVLGPYHRRTCVSVWTALAQIWQHCRFVADQGGVVLYQSAQ